MKDFPEDIDRKRFPGALTRFDIAGLVGAIAAFIIGALLGLFWSPLFLLGIVGAAVILLASRHAIRTPPPEADAIVSPVDGVLVSISTHMVCPAELRMDARDLVCLRIASSPASTNTVHAPMAGEIVSLIEEAGDTSVRTASDPDAGGLAAAYVTITSGGSQIGLRVATGGLGPRLEMQREAGDPVRVGRVIGIRRLGGWCDVWLDADLKLAVWPGMSLKAAETRLVLPASDSIMTGRPIRDEDVEEDTDPFEMPDLDEGDEPDDLDPPKTPEESASRQFSRLRKRVEKSSPRSGEED